jgi:transcription elongation factor Elf1
MIDYACPECGHDGPHTLVDDTADDEVNTYECGSCYCEFEVPGPDR